SARLADGGDGAVGGFDQSGPALIVRLVLQHEADVIGVLATLRQRPPELGEGGGGRLAVLTDDAGFAIHAPSAELMRIEQDLHAARAGERDDIEEGAGISFVERA